MDASFQKTLIFLVFILLGILLKPKFTSQNEVNGIKKIILNLALPATIFIALLGIDVEASLLLLPILALAFNIFLFACTPVLLPLIGLKKNTPVYRTARLLIPSLAPGLSCFPFVLEFLGEDYLAKAAMADLGNKVFVLIVLYLIAMRWYYARNQENNTGNKAKIISLLKTLVTEPVNLFIGLALLLLVFGIHMDSMPFVLSEALSKLSLMMTPLVLLFIGLAVKIKRKQFVQIASLLLVRAGLVFLLVGVLVIAAGLDVRSEILLALAFGLSACSFWPFAHLSLVDSLEQDKKKKNKTFDSNYAIGILALSFPLSTVLILAVLNSGALFTSSFNIFGMGLFLFGLGVLPVLLKYFFKKVKTPQVSGLKFDSTKPEGA